MQYVVAVTALERDLFIDQFTEEKVNDPRIIEYSRKVEVIPDPELDKRGPEFRHAIIAQVRTKDGRTLSERVDTARGSDKRPISVDEVIHKYTMLAGRVLPQKGVDDLHDIVLNLEKVPNVGELAKLLMA
jgi:aconitate decarboxylase